MLPWLTARLDGFRHLLPRRVHGMQDQTPAPPPWTPEVSFQATVAEVLALNGWLVWHDNDARRNEAGLPDVLAVRDQRLLLIELKTETGVMRQHQELWGYLLAQVGGNVEYLVLRPHDWALFLEVAR